MSFRLQLGWNQKKVNNTSRTFKMYYETDVVFKEDTAYSQPIFVMNKNKQNYTPVFPPAKADTGLLINNVNYAYCPQLSRYYWVDQIVFRTNDVVEIHCHTDVLATWKGTIENSPGYVLYTGNKDKRDGRLDDPRLQPELLKYSDRLKFITSNTFWSGYSVKLTTMSMGNATGSATISYFLSMEQFELLFQDLVGVIGQSQTNLFTIGGEMLKQGLGLGGIISAIQDIKLLPFPLSLYDTLPTTTKIYFGAYSKTITNSETGDVNVPWCIDAFGVEAKIENTKTITIPYRWTGLNGAFDDESKGEIFLRGPKYNRLVFKHPCGMEELNLDSFINIKKPEIRARYCYGCSSGDYAVAFWNKENGAFLGSASGNVSIDLLGIIHEGGLASFGGSLLGRGADFLMSKVAVKSDVVSTSNVKEDITDTGVDKKGDLKTKTNHRNTSSKTYNRTSLSDLTGIHGVFNSSFNPPQIGHYSTRGKGADMFIAGYGPDTSSGATPGSWAYDRDYQFEFILVSTLPAVIANNQYDYYAEIVGYPCGKYFKTLSLLEKGYVQCSMFSIDQSIAYASSEPPLLSDEREGLNNMLNSGFYLEEIEE